MPNTRTFSGAHEAPYSVCIGGLKWPEREVTTLFYPVLSRPTQGRHWDVNKKRHFVTYLVVYTRLLGARFTILGM